MKRKDGRHLPEFLMLEAYAAYAGLDEGISVVRKILARVASNHGCDSFQRRSFRDAFLDVLGIDIDDQQSVAAACARHGVSYPPDADGRLGALHRLLRRHVAPQTHGVFVVDGPFRPDVPR